MKFSEFLKEEHLSPSIDDNDVISTLEDNQIFYDRIKNSNSNKLIYNFDNRYSIEYDGEIFILFRHGNKIHTENARNRSEIEAAITKWNNSYSLADTELSDDDIDDYINNMSIDDEDNNQEIDPDDSETKDDDNDDESTIDDKEDDLEDKDDTEDNKESK